jgi:hypothetical protein
VGWAADAVVAYRSWWVRVAGRRAAYVAMPALTTGTLPGWFVAAKLIRRGCWG